MSKHYTQLEISDLVSRTVGYFCKKFKVSKPRLKRDNRMRVAGMVSFSPIMKGDCLYYNTKIFESQDVAFYFHVILHEIGHLKYGWCWSTVENEYRAEKFSLEQMKKMFPKLYKREVKRTRYLLRHGKCVDETHKIAYLRLKEYK